MKNYLKNQNRFFSAFLLLVLIAAIAFSAVGCDEKKDGDTAMTTTAAVTTTGATTAATAVGEGTTGFMFKVVHLDGSEKLFNVSTNKTKVGDALMESGLISGENGPYGLYVKTVDGELVDYDIHGKYWAFYVDGAYAPTGVDTTNIEAGKTYEFRAE